MKESLIENGPLLRAFLRLLRIRCRADCLFPRPLAQHSSRDPTLRFARLELEVAPVTGELFALRPDFELAGCLHHAVELCERAARPRDPSPRGPVRPRTGTLQPSSRGVEVSPPVTPAGSQLHGTLVDDRVSLRVAVVEAQARGRSGTLLHGRARVYERRRKKAEPRSKLGRYEGTWTWKATSFELVLTLDRESRECSRHSSVIPGQLRHGLDSRARVELRHR